MRRTLATMMAAGLLLAACSGDEPDILDLATEEPEPQETATADPEPDPEEEPEPEDPYAVPDEIDEPYVESVINAILEVRGEVLRESLELEAGETITAELMGLLFAVTEGAQRAGDIEEFQAYVDRPDDRGGLFDPQDMGGSTVQLEEIVHSEPDACVIAVGRWDRSAVSAAADNEQIIIFSLSRVSDAEPASGGNPTPWQWRDNNPMEDVEGNPIDAAFWGDLDYDAVLDHTCTEL